MNKLTEDFWTMMSILLARESLQEKIEERNELAKFLDWYVVISLLLNIVLILSGLTLVTVRITLVGHAVIDSLPLALYIFPLMIVLPSLLLAYYRNRTALFNLVILILSSVFLYLFSAIIRGFIISFALNIGAIIVIIILGKFRVEGDKKELGKKGLAWLVFLNLIGLAFPVGVYVMGQTPIETVQTSESGNYYLEVQLSNFSYPAKYIRPTTTLLDSFQVNNFGLDLHVNIDSVQSIHRLEEWMSALNQTNLKWTLTLSCERNVSTEGLSLISSPETLLHVFRSYDNGIDLVRNFFDTNGSVRGLDCIRFDMTLPDNEWNLFMKYISAADVSSFATLIRASLDKLNSSFLESNMNGLISSVHELGLECGVVVETFVIEDMSDGDIGVMKLCGLTLNTISSTDRNVVYCSRTRYSNYLLGDVGNYFVHVYSKSVGLLNGTHEWSIKIGTAGSVTDYRGTINPVYDSLSSFAKDAALASAHSVGSVIIDSLGSLLLSFGEDVVQDLAGEIDAIVSVSIRYTFRVYAFRAVFIAIDSFDVIMF